MWLLHRQSLIVNSSVDPSGAAVIAKVPIDLLSLWKWLGGRAFRWPVSGASPRSRECPPRAKGTGTRMQAAKKWRAASSTPSRGWLMSSSGPGFSSSLKSPLKKWSSPMKNGLDLKVSLLRMPFSGLFQPVIYHNFLSTPMIYLPEIFIYPYDLP